MGRPIDEFALAWGALAGESESEGWRSIPVSPAGPCALMVARRFPGNLEAVLVGFSTARIPTAAELPDARGFEMARADPHGDGKTWLALTRKESGSVDLFSEMVGDIAGALDVVAGEGEDRILQAMLSRVRAWQEFMRKGAQALSPEAELGLVGELCVLEQIIDAGLPVSLAVESWVGPVDGIQDFQLGTGALEVKATLTSQGFPAKIGSLEQLDDSIRKPLFVAGVRFAQRSSGRSLPQWARDLGAKFLAEPDVATLFRDRLMAAGFHEAHVDHYSRRFAKEGTKVVEVVDGFPRLIPGSVPDGVRRAIYEIDLDRARGGNVTVEEVLRMTGVL